MVGPKGSEVPLYGENLWWLKIRNKVIKNTVGVLAEALLQSFELF
jgi:hypothetical protein